MVDGFVFHACNVDLGGILLAWIQVVEGDVDDPSASMSRGCTVGFYAGQTRTIVFRCCLLTILWNCIGILTSCKSKVLLLDCMKEPLLSHQVCCNHVSTLLHIHVPSLIWIELCQSHTSSHFNQAKMDCISCVGNNHLIVLQFN